MKSKEFEDSSNEKLILYKKYLKIFQLCVTQTSRNFDSFSSYWYTPFSSRDRYNSGFQVFFMRLAELEYSIKQNSESLRNLDFDDLWLFRIVREFFEKEDKKITLSIKNKAILLGRYYFSRVQNIKKLLGLLQELFFVSVFKCINSPKQNINNLDYLFICPLDLPFLYDGNHVYKDRYFGYLPYKFYKLGKRISITGTLPTKIEVYRKKSNPPKDFPVFPILSLINLSDLWLLFFYILREILFPPKINLKTKKIFKPFHDIVNNELRDSYTERIFGRILFLGVKRVFSNSPNVSIIHTFENNPWERAIIQAHRKYNKGGKIIGYLHCAVLESHQKNYTDKIELIRRPFPDRVYTTGTEAKNALMRLGNYPLRRLISGGDLRGPKLANIQQKLERPGSIKRILFLMEGLTSMEKILRIILEVKKIKPDLIFSVRPHPALSWESSFLRGLDSWLTGVIIKLDPLEPLDTQLLTADTVIYKGSTSAMYAAYAGLPLLHYKDNWWLSDDPLYFADILKEDFASSEELLHSIVKLGSITDSEYSSRIERQKIYVENYLKQKKRIYL